MAGDARRRAGGAALAGDLFATLADGRGAGEDEAAGGERLRLRAGKPCCKDHGRLTRMAARLALQLRPAKKSRPAYEMTDSTEACACHMPQRLPGGHDARVLIDVGRLVPADCLGRIGAEPAAGEHGAIEAGGIGPVGDLGHLPRCRRFRAPARCLRPRRHQPPAGPAETAVDGDAAPARRCRRSRHARTSRQPSRKATMAA